MEKKFISEKIVYHRKLKGITQEELAEKTELNVRTIQRLESGEVDPRLHTLKVISEALEISMDVFTPPPSKEEKGKLALVHLCAVMGFAFPLGNIIVPVIYWLYKKDRINQLKTQGLAVINAQITYTIVAFSSILIGVALAFYSKSTQSDFKIPIIVILSFGAIVELIGIITPIVNAIRIYREKKIIQYPFKVNFIR